MIERRVLGRSGLRVSRLCFGSLTISPSQAALSESEGGQLIAYAFSKGINFIDTAELYQNYGLIRQALMKVSECPVICTKTYAWDRTSAAESLEKARRELDLDTIDIMLLHEQETCLTMHGHSEAATYFLEQKEKGRIRAFGLSTHAIEPVLAIKQAVAESADGLWQEYGIEPGPWKYADIVHPLLNLQGIGLLDGKAQQMQQAAQEASLAGLGIFGMKMLGGGHLIDRFQEAAAYALGLSYVASYAVGMQNTAEVDANVAMFSTDSSESLERFLIGNRESRRLLVSDWCIGCGRCVERCASKALRLSDDHVIVDPDRCTLCSYCATVCRDFVLKII